MKFSSLAVILILVGCSAGETKSSEFVPDLPILCTSAQASDCSGTGLSVFVGIAKTLSVDCDTYLSGLNSSGRQASFDASGTVLSSRNGIYLTGTVTTWVNSLGASTDVLFEGYYALCAFIDTNGNDFIDANEPVGRGTIVPGQTGVELDQWEPAFN